MPGNVQGFEDLRILIETAEALKVVGDHFLQGGAAAFRWLLCDGDVEERFAWNQFLHALHGVVKGSHGGSLREAAEETGDIRIGRGG